MNKQLEKMVEENRQKIVETLQSLLRIKSVLDPETITPLAPFGKGINDALEFMTELGKNDGFDVIRDGGYALEISYGEGEESVGILCHLDVVPEGKNWLYPPYEARIVDNKIFARGTTDDKGPTIACYYALKIIKDAKIKLKKKIKLICGTDEETGWRGISHYLDNYPMPEIGFAPDCSFPLVYGEKGRMAIDLAIDNVNICATVNDALVSIKGGERYNVVIDEAEGVLKIDQSMSFSKYLSDNNLEGDVVEENGQYHYIIKGKAAHAMEPEKGINAGTHLCNFFRNYTSNELVHYVANFHHLDFELKKLELDYDDYEMGPLTCNIGIIDISKKTSRVTLDIRYPERYDQPNFEKVLNNVLEKHNLKITHFTNKAPHYVSPNDDLVVKLYDSYVRNTNDYINKPFTVGGGTYASVLDKAVAFGMGFPGEVELAHQPNECLDIDSLIKGVKIYLDAILSIGEIDA